LCGFRPQDPPRSDENLIYRFTCLYHVPVTNFPSVPFPSTLLLSHNITSQKFVLSQREILFMGARGSFNAGAEKKRNPWPESASERHFSAKLVTAFAGRGCYVVSVTDPYGSIPGFLDRSFQVASH
jgi:hypothetical protein